MNNIEKCCEVVKAFSSNFFIYWISINKAKIESEMIELIMTILEQFILLNLYTLQNWLCSKCLEYQSELEKKYPQFKETRKNQENKELKNLFGNVEPEKVEELIKNMVKKYNKK